MKGRNRMAKTAIMLANGCEEIEALTVVDMLRRAKLTIDMISITQKEVIEGSHGICFYADKMIEDVNFDEYDAIVLPGGIPGTTNLGAHPVVTEQIKAFAAAGKLVCAICAAPSVLGANGILEGKKATCHPGWEDKLTGADVLEDEVVCDGNVITSRGMGTAIPFSLAIISRLADEETYKKVCVGIVYNG